MEKLRAYYASKISDHISQTDEGYWICTDVRIARIGAQDYLAEEVGMEDRAGEIIPVHRTPEEVFDKATLASFRGKAVTDDHPPVDVTAENYKKYIKGAVQDVWEGKGKDEGYLVADLIVYDPSLIQKIQDGKREISCGYDCDLIQDEDGNLYQTKIRGNHVAVVDNGRAGETVKIIDEEKPTKKKRGTFMGIFGKRQTKKQKAIMRALKLVDEHATDEEVAKAIEDELEVVEKVEDEEVEAKLTDEEVKTIVDEVAARIADDLEGKIEAIVEEKMEAYDSVKELDELEAEVKDEGEEEVIVDPEYIEDEEEAEVITDEDCTDSDNSNLVATTDAAIKRVIDRAKKDVLKEKDPKKRKQIKDDTKILVRELKGKRAKSNANGYQTLIQNKSKDKVRDVEARQNDNPYQKDREKQLIYN